MMKTISLALVLTYSLALCAPFSRQETEPPLGLVLELDGVPFEGVVGEPFKIQIEGREIRARVQLKETRLFSAGGVSFRYPRDMSFEFDGSDGIPLWTLDGGDCQLTLVEIEMEQGLDALRQQLEFSAMALGAEDVEFEAWSITTSGVERSGLRARFPFEMLGSDVELRGFVCPVGERCVNVVLQDFPDDGEHDDEADIILGYLRESFVVTGGR